MNSLAQIFKASAFAKMEICFTFFVCVLNEKKMFSCQLRTLLSVLQYILPFFIGHQSPCYTLYITHTL